MPNVVFDLLHFTIKFSGYHFTKQTKNGCIEIHTIDAMQCRCNSKARSYDRLANLLKSIVHSSSTAPVHLKIYDSCQLNSCFTAAEVCSNSQLRQQRISSHICAFN